jgi:hypothetical protein
MTPDAFFPAADCDGFGRIATILRPLHPFEKGVRGAALAMHGFKEQDADQGRVADDRVMAGTQHLGLLFLPSWKARS